MKRNWKGRFLDFIFEFPWGKCFRLIGLTLILFVLEHHFKIDFTIWEATFLGLGIGLYID
jgi:hypothetical protein